MCWPAAVNGRCRLWCSWRFLCFNFQQAASELLWPPFLYGHSCSDLHWLLLTGSAVITLSEGKMLEWCPWDQGAYPMKRLLQIPIFCRNFHEDCLASLWGGTFVKRLVHAKPGCSVSRCWFPCLPAACLCVPSMCLLAFFSWGSLHLNKPLFDIYFC